MSIIWIFVYSFIIVWFTYDVSMALNLGFSIIPMFIYPIGISFRDKKKFKDFEVCLAMFKQELPDQEITLAETYSPQIFQMTGLAGFAWLLFTLMYQEQVKFYNESIPYQLPILIGVVIIKYGILFYYHFQTHKSLFKANIYQFLVFLIVVLIIEYKTALLTFFNSFG